MSDCKLGEIIDLISGRDLPKEDYNDKVQGIPYIMGASNMLMGELNVERWTDKPVVVGKKDDIIISVKGTIGALLILKEEKVHLSRQVMAIRSKGEINNDYIFFFLQYYLQILKSKAKGLIPGISREDILEAPISIFTPAIENKIINCLQQAQQLIDLKKRQLALLSDLTQSIFYEMFGDPVRNPMGWEKLKLKESSKVITGNTPSRKVPEYYGSYLEWIKSDNINTPNNFLTEATEYLSELGVKKARVVNSGTILMTCIAGSISCIGNVAIANRRVSFNQQINAIVPDKYNIEFLFSLMTNSKKFIQNSSTNSMKGMLSKSNLEELEFIVPPNELQTEFANKVQTIEGQKSLMQQSLVELENNYKSLMQRAFKGELFQ